MNQQKNNPNKLDITQLIRKLVQQYPNDQDLGREVRKMLS